MLPETIEFSLIEHFVSIDVGLNEATFNVIDINGEEIDKIVVNRRNSI